MLTRCLVWAVVGDVMNPLKPAHMVAARLKHFNKVVHHVNPRDRNCLPSLAVAHEKEPIEAVNLIISPKIGLGIVEEMIQLEIKCLFIQPGAGTAAIIEKARAADIEIVESCVLITPDKDFREQPEQPSKM